jgi:hypothetical protein
VGISATACEFQMNGAIDLERLVESTFCAGTRTASGEQRGGENCDYCECDRAALLGMGHFVGQYRYTRDRYSRPGILPIRDIRRSATGSSR